MQITAAEVRSIQSFRHDLRLAGCWGACYEVACFVEHKHGWRRIDGVYQLPDGRPIFCHSWNVMSDGAIIDGKADQFGEGADIAVLPSGSAAFQRYREKYTATHNPQRTSWLAGNSYVGMPDTVFWDTQEASSKLRPGWWLSDRSTYLSWFRSGVKHYPMFVTMLERYRQRGYDVAPLE